MRLNGSQIVCESLLREGVEVIFGLPGGAILPLYQTLPEYPQLRHILVRHEQGAAHAADGYGRVTGKPGVAWATSGPGATNLVTGIATAQMDSVPMVIVTGQVSRASIGSDAFQETDTTGITLPITKHNYLVMNAADIPRAIKEAFHIASTGRPGPVLVDIPKDVFMEEAEFVYPDGVDLPGYKPTLEGHPSQVKRAAKLIAQAQRPVILAGHGIIISQAYDEVRELAEKAQIPVITTLLGISSFPDDHLLCVGMPGMHGMAYASLAIEEADLLIALGMRFDDRITGKTSAFAVGSKKIHVEIDPSEIGKNVKVDVPIVGDLKLVLRDLNRRVKPATHLEWVQRIEDLKRDHPSMIVRDTDKLIPQFVVKELSEATNGEAIVVTGVGQHQMWAAQHYTYRHPRSLITSGGSGAMGYEVPGRDGGAGRQARQGGLVRRRRRRLPDDHGRAGDAGGEQDPREVRHHQQLLPRDGPAVAGVLLPQELRGDGLLPQPGLREAGRSLRDAGNTRHRQDAGQVGHNAGDGIRRPGHRRLRGRGGGERLPDDPGGPDDRRPDRGADT